MALMIAVMLQAATSNADTLRAIIEEMRTESGALGDQTQLMQMRLQKYLDAYTKCFEMLSNIMKRISQTSEEMAQNLK
jgi:hypothetical protein